MSEFPHYRQLDQMDCGPTCLRMVSKYYGRHYNAQTLREKSQISRDGVSMLGLAEAADKIGLKASGARVSLDQLVSEVPLPCILHWNQNHFVVLYKITKKSWISRQFMNGIQGGKRPIIELNHRDDRRSKSDADSTVETIDDSDTDVIFHVADPASRLLTYSKTELENRWLSANSQEKREGFALLLEPTPRFYDQEEESQTNLGFGQLLRYLLKYKRLVLQLIFGMLMGSGLSLLLPVLTQAVVDVGIGTQNLRFIYIVLIAQLMLTVGSSTVDFLRGWILLHISTRLNLGILSEFFSKLMRLPISFFDVKQFGDIMQRIGDHHRIESFLTGQTLSVLFSLVNLLAFGFVLAYFHITIFLVAIGASILYAFWVVLFLNRRKKIDAMRFDVASRNQNQVIQLILGMHDIRLSGAETRKRWDWERIQAKLFKVNVRSLSLSQFQQGGAILINQTKNIVITFLAAKAVIDGELTLGEMMSVQYILGQFNAPIEQAIGFLQSWQDAQISLERLNEVHSLPDEEPYGIALRHEFAKEQDIVIDNLNYSYPGAGTKSTLKDISLTIPFGKTTAIVGTSGSGKTTLLKLLLRFYEPVGGRIYLVPAGNAKRRDKSMLVASSYYQTQKSNIGVGLDMISHKTWRQQCGVVMQEGHIFSDTIARNIAVSDEIIDQEKLYHAAMVANIHTFVESLPLGYHTKIGAEGNGISQGQKQRILIARSVYKDPQLILFDEATNSLDANNEAVIMGNLEQFFQGRTVVVVAHRLSTVKNAHQIVVMEHGEIVEIGSHDQLLMKQGKYYELVSNQLDLG